MIELSGDTIGTIKERKIWLKLVCNNCENRVLFPTPMIEEMQKRYRTKISGKSVPRLSDDLPVELAAAYFRCDTCGGKDLVSEMTDALDNGWKRV